VTSRTALLAEILEHPAADPPRLVLADQLEQEGDLDRANLIRHQIRRASLPAWDAAAVALELEERALLASHEEAWRAGLPPLAGVRYGRLERGFVGKVAFDRVETYLEHVDQIARVIPIHAIVLPWPRTAKPPRLPARPEIDEVTFTGAVMRPEDLKWLASCALLSSVRTLNLIDSELRSGLPHLLKSPHLGNLATLRIPLHHVGNSGLSKLIAAKTLPALAELELSVGADEALGSNGHAASPPITSKSVLELAAWPQLAQLRTLDLSGARLGAEGLLMLLASPYTRGLRTLRIRDIKDGDWEMDDSLGAFRSGPAGTLDELDISGNDLDPEGAVFLGQAKALRELKVLRLANVRSNSFDRLGQASFVRSLRVLACSDQPLPHLLRRAEQLHTLELTASSTPLSKAIAHLADAPPPALRVLDLSRTRVDEAGLRALGQAALPGLAAVILPRRRDVSPDTIGAFATSKLGRQLTSLDTGILAIDRLPRPAELIDSDVL